MTLAKIEAIIEPLRHERYRWTRCGASTSRRKARRRSGPLGLPTWSDKLLQEVIRLILEAYYEPQFSAHSHGSARAAGATPRSREVYHDVDGHGLVHRRRHLPCFDSLDHEVLLASCARNIHDNRFLRLIEELLEAGYLEEWRFNATLSGVPQGGIVSPVLANIYLDRLDRFVETDAAPRVQPWDRREG